jgi:hypothetical protein
MSMTEAVAWRRSRTDSVVELVAALAVVVLTILGLAGVESVFLVAIATIVFGAALLLQGNGVVGQLNALAGRGSSAVLISELGVGGWSTLFLAGIGGVVLGILALLQIATIDLVAIAIIAYEGALFLSTNATVGLRLARVATSVTDEPLKVLAEGLAADAMGAQTLVGLGAIALGILALSGFVPVTLVLIGLLILGSLATVSGAFMINRLVGG